MKRAQTVYTAGFVVFGLVIIFSILVEIDILKAQRSTGRMPVSVAELEQEIDRRSGLEQRRFLKSLSGREVLVAGSVTKIGLIHMTLDVPSVVRDVKMNFTRSVRNNAMQSTRVAVTGTLTRVSALDHVLLLEISGMSGNETKP
jgi:hypothetical protein